MTGDEKTAADNDDDEPMKDVAEVREDSHCVFNVNSYQMVFVANNESFLYKRHAFTRAKQVSTSIKNALQKIQYHTYLILTLMCAVSSSSNAANEEAVCGVAGQVGRPERQPGRGEGYH